MPYLFFCVWRFIPDISEEVQTNVYSHSVICLILPLSAFIIIYNYMHRNSLAEVIHDNSCKDFLQHGIRFSCMKVRHSDGVFKLSETCFYTPSQVIQIFQHRWRELIFRKARRYRFPCILGYFEPYNTDFQAVRRLKIPCGSLQFSLNTRLPDNYGLPEGIQNLLDGRT